MCIYINSIEITINHSVNQSTSELKHDLFISFQVYLTLLEISNEHLEKLGCDEELTCEDRATIYYSLPYDMFYEGTIPSLVETFVKLNNM